MSGITDTLFGSSPSVSYSSPYGSNISQIMPGLTSNANALTGNVTGLTNAGQGNIGTAATNAANLASGILPASYTNAETQNINNAVQNSLGSGVARLAASGTFGGSSLDNLTNQIGQNVANAAAQNYNQSMGTASGLNQGLAGIGAQQAQLGLGEQSTSQGLLNALLSQNNTQVNQGSSGLLGSALGGFIGNGGILSGLLGGGSSSGSSGGYNYGSLIQPGSWGTGSTYSSPYGSTTGGLTGPLISAGSWGTGTTYNSPNNYNF